MDLHEIQSNIIKTLLLKSKLCANLVKQFKYLSNYKNVSRMAK